MTNPCPACHKTDNSVFVQNPEDNEYFTKRGIDCVILSCQHCQALFQSPFPTSEETNTFYGENYQNYTSSKVPFLSDILKKQTQAAAQNFIKRFGNDASVLDFGCGNGLFLQNLSDAGMKNLYGYDVSVRFDDQIETRLTLFNDLKAIEESGIKFDVIRMHHVIEHLADLDETMSLLAGLLKEDGIIIGQTPNAAHYTSRMFKKFWGPLHYPYHTVLFAKESLLGAAPRWQLRVEKISPCLMPTGWAMSFENIYKSMAKSKHEGRSMFYTLFIAGSAPFALTDYILSSYLGTAIFDFELKPSRS